VKCHNVDTILGPEMRSTGEVMGIDTSFAHAFLKAQIATGSKMPTSGTAFLSLREADKPAGVEIATKLAELGFELMATGGTAAHLEAAGVVVRRVNKVLEGRPHCVDAIESGEIDLVINTTEGAQAIRDSQSLRRAALLSGISYFTTIRAARAATDSIAVRSAEPLRVESLQSQQRERDAAE
jgi:carbamoyl-phosphate synthase large subunit